MKTYTTKTQEVKAVQYLENEKSVIEVQNFTRYFGGYLELSHDGSSLEILARISMPEKHGDKSFTHQIEATQWVVYINDAFFIIDDRDFKEYYDEVLEEPRQSNLVDHAKRELEIIGEEPGVVDAYLKIVRIFADMGHSGASAFFAVPVITQLLSFKPLSELTDDPEDWIHVGADVWGEKGGIYQNRRNGQAFSKDGGKTYYLLSDNSNAKIQTKWYTSKEHKK